MSWEQDNAYKSFISYIRILECRANEKARNLNNEEAKRGVKEYEDMRKKMEKIRGRKFFALANEENEDMRLYEKISKMAYDSYKNIEYIGWKYSDNELNKLYDEVNAMISDYKIEKEPENSEEKKIKGEKEK